MIKITASEADLLHAASGMDMFRTLDRNGLLAVTIAESEGLIAFGYLEQRSSIYIGMFPNGPGKYPSEIQMDARRVTITPAGLTALNNYIGRKVKC